jgi:hypothetical protein
MALIGEKSALGSIGIWGSLISLVPVLLETASDLGAVGVFGPHSAAIVAGVGGLISLWGRFTATKKITSVLPKK